MNELTDIIRKIAVDAVSAVLKPMSIQTGIEQPDNQVQLEQTLNIKPSEQDSITVKIEDLDIKNVQITGEIDGEEVTGTLNFKADNGTIKFKRLLQEGDYVQVLKHNGMHKYRVII